MSDPKTARIGAMKRTLETVEETSAARIREIAAVLRLSQRALPNGTSDAAAGIAAAQRMLIDLDGAIYDTINEVHPCGPS